MGRIVDIRGNLFNPPRKRKSGLDSTWSDSHLKRSEVFNLQLREVLRENLIASRFVNWITGCSMIDLTTSFTKLIRERAR